MSIVVGANEKDWREETLSLLHLTIAGHLIINTTFRCLKTGQPAHDAAGVSRGIEPAIRDELP